MPGCVRSPKTVICKPRSQKALKIDIFSRARLWCTQLNAICGGGKPLTISRIRLIVTSKENIHMFWNFDFRVHIKKIGRDNKILYKQLTINKLPIFYCSWRRYSIVIMFLFESSKTQTVLYSSAPFVAPPVPFFDLASWKWVSLLTEPRPVTQFFDETAQIALAVDIYFSFSTKSYKPG